ncbi:MAG: type II/IV secretion system protein [Elusimicrobiales bacterium]|nr:type II/IV secretion system protein [Elusimicrobiales bacterium]
MAFWGQNKPEEKNTSQENKPSSPNQVNQPSDGTLANDYQNLIKTKGRSPAIDLAIKLSDLLLEHAVRERTSDIHIETQGANLRIRFRVDGILQDMLTTPKSADIPLTQRIRVLAGFDPEPPKSFRNEEGRFQKMIANRAIQIRVSSFPTVNGEKLVLRVLDRQGLGMDIEQLGMNKDTLTVIKKLIRNPYGIFFITGSTGSGKTTSLYALLKNISTPMINIITLEDPVEYRLEGINQSQISQKTGFTWAEGLRTVLRQDPDVIMVGEIRDYETAEISLRSALTGHLLFTTIHTINAPSIIERLFEMGVPPFLIASSMLGAISQRLVRKVCPHCAQKAAPPSETVVKEFVKNMDSVEAKLVTEMILKPDANYKVEKGCPKCRNTGYLGRTGIFELMLMNEEIRKQVLDHSATDIIKRTAIGEGQMKTLLMDGIVKARDGVTTLSEIIRVTATMV